MSFQDDAQSQKLDPNQQKVVDDAFQNLFGFPWRTNFSLDGNLSPEEQLLTDMLGASAAARILTTNGRKNLRLLAGRSSLALPKRLVAKWPRPYKHPTPKAPPVAQRLAASSAMREEQQVSSVAIKEKNAVSGAQKLLEAINDKGKVSTIAKTSADWDQFKEKSGLGDHLEEQATSNKAYLNKQDFLERVDHRTFEVEKKERDRERHKRGG